MKSMVLQKCVFKIGAKILKDIFKNDVMCGNFF